MLNKMFESESETMITQLSFCATVYILFILLQFQREEFRMLNYRSNEYC